MVLRTLELVLADVDLSGRVDDVACEIVHHDTDQSLNE